MTKITYKKDLKQQPMFIEFEVRTCNNNILTEKEYKK